MIHYVNVGDNWLRCFWGGGSNVVIYKKGNLRIMLTWRRVGVTIVGLEKQYNNTTRLSECLQRQLSRMQCACAVLYCLLQPVQLYIIFPHYLTNGLNFRKKAIGHKMRVLIFSTTLVRNTSYSKKNSARCYHKCTQYSCKVFVIFVMF